MALEKGFVVILLMTVISVAVLQAAPQQKATPDQPTPQKAEKQPNTQKASAAVRQEPEVQSPPGGPAEGTAADPPDKPASPADSEPADPTNSEPADPVETSSQKPAKPTQSPKPPKDDEETMAEESLSNCWTCLLEAAEDLCSYLLDWTASGKISAVNLFSFFQGRSSEESDETTEKPGKAPLVAFSNLLRFRRSSHRSRRSFARDVPVQGVPGQSTFEDIPVEESDFLDLLNSFYSKIRDRFLREHPGTLSRGTVDLYRRPYEIADVAAYFLGLPRDRLVQVYERLKTKDIGNILLKALDNRLAMLNGEQRTVNFKTFGNLTPTSISYFFKELFASLNGIATGFSELLGIVFENEAPPTQPNVIVK